MIESSTTQKTFLIAGGSSGIGYQLSCILEKEGHKVIVLSRNRKSLSETITHHSVDFSEDVLSFPELEMPLKAENKSYLYQVNAANNKHELWQRDSLGIEIYSIKVATQKLIYVHQNPIKGKYQLAKDYLSYHYSSARFYENGEDEFGFLKNIFRQVS